MVKVQRFLTEQRQALVIGLTVLLILAEAFRFISSNNLMYQILMATAGVIGLLPILFTAISSLEVRLISIDVLVSIAVIGAFIIGEYNEAAIVTWLFMVGEVLENATLRKTRSAIKQLTELAPRTAVVIDEDGNASDEDVDFIDPAAG